MPAGLPPSLHPRRRPAAADTPPARSASLLVRLAPGDTALFRFLLEAYGHTAYFTMLEKRTSLARVIFSPHQAQAVRAALRAIGQSLPLRVAGWPFPCGLVGAVPRSAPLCPARDRDETPADEAVPDSPPAAGGMAKRL